MSNLDLLTNDETLQAEKEGWLVGYVYDPRTERCVAQVLPVRFAKPFATAESTAAYVIQRAKAGNPLALKALQLVMASHTLKTRKKK
jgi:hypothetical protein